MLSPLPPAIARWLETEHAVVNFRQEYRGYRVGGSRGAHGEGKDLGASCETGLGLHDLEVHDHNVATEWRLAYRRFRVGQAEGARGEFESLGASLTGSQWRSLPVVQMLQLKRRERAESEGFCASGYHVHFGAGRLGLGLILPALEAGPLPYVILQSRNNPFKDLTGPSTVVKINGSRVAKLAVFDDNSQDVFAHLNGHLPLEDRGAIVFVERGAVSKLKLGLIENAHSMSCSVGPGIGQLVETLSSVGHLSASYLLACENDHAAVEKMTAALAPMGLNVVSCMVDRICSHVHASDSETLEVTAEPFSGEIVLMGEVPRRHLGLGGPNVIIPTTEAQREYFAERKFLLVNGTHTVLAFLTLLRQKEQGVEFDPPGEFTLLNWHSCSDAERANLWALTVARLLLLSWEYDSGVLRDAHGVEDDEALCEILLSYAKAVVKRFSTVTDTTKRVLGGGVDTRFNGRLKNVEHFLDVCNPASFPVGKKLLDRSNVGYCTLAAQVHTLVTAAHALTTQGRDDQKRQRLMKLPTIVDEPLLIRSDRTPTERRVH